MKNIIDYVKYATESLEERPFNQVDSLVLSQFSYIHLKGLVPGFKEGLPPMRLADLPQSEHFETLFEKIRESEKNRDMVTAMAANPRFQEMRLQYFAADTDKAKEKQFAAVTFLLEDGTLYIAFRGTDATLTGWKEDFNMAFMSPVPSQAEAVRYLEKVAFSSAGAIRVGGHSKGGNLAVYAAMNCRKAIQQKLIAVYSHDGPGFKDDVFQTESFLQIKERIYKSLPQSSIIGMLLEHQEDYTVVLSDRAGIMQHDPFSWCVQGYDFCKTEEISSGARHLDRTLNAWIASMSEKQREALVDTLYQMIDSVGISDLQSISQKIQGGIPVMLKAMKGLDQDTGNHLVEIIKKLAILSFKDQKAVGGKRNSLLSLPQIPIKPKLPK